jgi:hypothetical protein
MSEQTIPRTCAAAGIRAGRKIREAIHSMPASRRATKAASPLKPRVGELARYVDHVGDSIGIEHLEQLSRDIGQRIDLIVDPRSGEVHSLGSATGRTIVFAYMDAVDGTIKVGGLGNDVENRRFRIANDGGWASAIAFTMPTTARLEDLSVRDFAVAALVDGNPTRYPAYPQEIITWPDADGLASFDVTGETAWNRGAVWGKRVHTSTNTDLSQCMVYLDSFQAFDRETRMPGDEELAVELYRRLINRHDGGAFDVLRQYANLSALQRVMLGWREPPEWLESQGAAFIAINENMFNLIPAVPIIAGAGGRCVDFDGRPLRDRKILAGRTSVAYAANEGVCRKVLELIGKARGLGIGG